MGWRQVLGLYLVLGGLAAEYGLIERRRPPTPHGLPARQRFLPLRPDELRQVRLDQGGRTVVSRRSGDRWVVVDPPNAAIPPDLIAAFARALTGAEQIDFHQAHAALQRLILFLQVKILAGPGQFVRRA